MAEQDAISTMAAKEVSNELLPPEGHEDVGRKVFRILAEILQDKQALGLPKKWIRHYELSKNKHWKQESDKVPLVTANLLFAHRQRTINLLTDNNPTFNVARVGQEQEGKDQDPYDKLLKTCEYWWLEYEQQAILEKSVLNGEMYGCTIEKMVFNADCEYGLQEGKLMPIGEVECQVIDPFYFGVYPPKQMDLQKAEAVLHFRPMSVREARRRWPEFALKIRPDSEIVKELGDTKREVQANSKGGSSSGGFFGTIAGVIMSMVNTATGGSKTQDSDELLIVECWCRDYTQVQVEGTTVPKYPGTLRCVTTCNGGEVVLSDKWNPSINPELTLEEQVRSYLFDKYPFSFTQSVTDTANPWGMSDYEQLETLQLEYDKTISQFTLWKDKASRLKIINPANSGVANSEFTNAPGIINPVSTEMGSGIRYMEPPVPPADLVNALSVYKDIFFLVAGTFELEAAQTPGREVVAYKAIAALIERASTMLKGKIRAYGKMIRERGRMYVSLAQNFYMEERWISYDQDGSPTSAAITGESMRIPAKLTVVTGSTLPISKVQIREESIELFNKQAIDRDELLKRLEWPDRKTVLKRMSQGPFGQLWERMKELGAPELLLQYLEQLAQMEDKEYKKEQKQGNIPDFFSVLNSSLDAAAQSGGVPPTTPPPSPLDNAEVAVKQAEVAVKDAQRKKLEADASLVYEQIKTEQVNRAVSAAGVGFDNEKLKIERAKTVADMEERRHARNLETVKTTADLDKSRHDQTLETTRTAADIANQDEQTKIQHKQTKIAADESFLKTSEAKSKGSEPYKERGLKSNNQKK